MIDKIISYIYTKKMIKHRIKEIKSLPLEISFIMNFECNYNCVYCCAYKPKDKSEFRKYNGDEWTNVFVDYYKKYGKCDVVLSGGEPLLYNDSIDFLINISKFHYIHLSTNLFIKKEIVERIIKESNIKNIYVSASYHPTQADLEEFIEKMKLLKNHGADTHAVFVLYPKTLNNIDYYDTKFKSASIPISYFPFMGQFEGRNFPTEYSEDDLEVVRKYTKGYSRGNKVDKVTQLDTKGMLCFAGSKSISINPFGDVRRCISYNKIMGSIFDKNFRLFDKPMPCEENVCGCVSYWKYHLRVGIIESVRNNVIQLKNDPFERRDLVAEQFKTLNGVKTLAPPKIITPLENEVTDYENLAFSWEINNPLNFIEDIELRIIEIVPDQESQPYIFRISKHSTKLKIPKKIISHPKLGINKEIKYNCILKVISSNPSKYLDSEFSMPRNFLFKS